MTPCAVEIVQYLSYERLHHIFVVPVVLLVDCYLTLVKLFPILISVDGIGYPWSE